MSEKKNEIQIAIEVLSGMDSELEAIAWYCWELVRRIEMARRPEKQGLANQNLIDRWESLPIDLPYPPEEFINIIDSMEVVSLIGVPDGKELPVVAILVDAIRKLNGLDYEGAKAGLIRAFERIPSDPL